MMTSPVPPAPYSESRASDAGLLLSIKSLRRRTQTRIIQAATEREKHIDLHRIPHRPTIYPKTCSTKVRDELWYLLKELFSHGRLFPGQGVSKRTTAMYASSPATQYPGGSPSSRPNSSDKPEDEKAVLFWHHPAVTVDRKLTCLSPPTAACMFTAKKPFRVQ